MLKNISRIILLGLIVTAFGCSGYEKVLKNNDYEQKYKFATKLFKEGKYQKSIKLYEQLIPLYRGTDKASTVTYYAAHAYYKSEDYIMAGYYFNRFVKEFPRDPKGVECEFLAAHCSYMESPRPELDQTATKEAIKAFQIFISHNPNNPKSNEAQILINELKDKLIEKDFYNAKLYYQLSDYKAAIISLRNSIHEFPETKYREDILFLLVESSYLLAENSVEDKKMERYQNTVDEYYSFIGEFPNSEYAKTAEKMFESANKALTKYKTSNL
ncbi:MAG: outer membrane protein assembly factor BamD [Bacteroidales bacterium]|nr:outer membrane protein assembly factor BamD [Bacteroidales bacterium]